MHSTNIVFFFVIMHNPVLFYLVCNLLYSGYFLLEWQTIKNIGFFVRSKPENKKMKKCVKLKYGCCG